jgi:hypothetical protein
LRAERDLLQVQLRTMAAGERSVVTELHRLRQIGFGTTERERTSLHYLFVVSVGRTGSTLVQGVLNSVPGVVIRGENGGFVTDLFRLHRKSLHHRDRLERENTLMRATNAWWGMDGYPEDLALREFRHLTTDLVLRPEPGVHTVGFKEITWPDDEVAPFIDFMRQVFPGARFVFSTRKLEEVATSGFWANRVDAMPRLEALEGAIRSAMDALGPDAFEVRYEDIAGDVDGFRPLFGWLGFDFKREVVAAVAGQPHSYAPRSAASPAGDGGPPDQPA